MSVSWLKYSKDNKSFKLLKNLGMDVYEVDDLEETDNKIKELVKKEYNTIIVSNQIANFSEDIIRKYSKSEKINIIITPNKNE